MVGEERRTPLRFLLPRRNLLSPWGAINARFPARFDLAEPLLHEISKGVAAGSVCAAVIGTHRCISTVQARSVRHAALCNGMDCWTAHRQESLLGCARDVEGF